MNLLSESKLLIKNLHLDYMTPTNQQAQGLYHLCYRLSNAIYPQWQYRDDVPELLSTSDRKGVSVMDIVGVLTKVLQDQQITISVLTEKIKALEPPIQKSY